eukprot:6211978-Pleurochrysis_carterae.AAC.3
MGDVFFLLKRDAGVGGGNVNIEQSEQVINVTSQGKPVRFTTYLPRHGKYTRIRLALSETELKKPRKQRTLPPSSRLRHPVHRFLNTTHPRPPISAQCSVPGGRMAIHHFVVFKVAL